MLRRKTASKKESSGERRGMTLASILLSMRAVTKDQLQDAAAKKAEHDDMLLASTLRSLGYCTSDQVSRALQIQSRMMDGDKVNVALDLMEARVEQARVLEEEMREALVKKQREPIMLSLSPAIEAKLN